MDANEKFKYEQVMKGESKVILLRGIFDEDTNFTSLTKLDGPLTFNWKAITSINSCGVRSWVNFLKDISSMPVFYEECPSLVVRQMNMVPSFAGHAKVLSVYVPYVCDNCDTETLKLVESSQFATVAEVMPCESCGKGEMEFDGQPEQYFAFAK